MFEVVINERNRLVDVYMDSIRSYPLLGREINDSYAREYFETKNPKLRDLLVISNLRLPPYIIKKNYAYMLQMFPFLDIVQEANIGLFNAVEKYDPDKGTSFSTCVAWQIRGALTNLYRRSHFEKSEAIVSLNDEYLQEVLSVSDLRNSFDEAYDRELQDIMNNFIERLPTNVEKDLMFKRILSEDPISQREFGENYGMSRMWSSMAEKRLKGKLKNYFGGILK